MMNACIFNIQRYSLHDGGGIRTIVFFKGCPFTCPWCCNPESLSTKPQIFYKEILCMNCSKKINGKCNTDPEDCPTGAKEMIGKTYTIEEVYDIVKRDIPFYESSGGGVTLSGGEFLMQQDFALSLLKKCKENNIHTAVESTLALPIKDIDALSQCVDKFLIDFKIMDPQKSKEILHLNVEQMKSNVGALLEKGCTVIPRIPLIPEYTATKENLIAIVETIQQFHLKEVHLLPFHQLGEGKYKSIDKEYQCAHLKTFRDEEIEEIDQYFKASGLNSVIHGN